MRTLCLCLLALLACGPSSRQVKVAKLTVYKLSSSSMMDLSMQVAQRTYQIGAVDEVARTFATQPQWYSSEGGRRGATNEGNGDYIHAGGGDVELTLIVKIETISSGKVAVTITPRTLQLISGSPQPRELDPEDPNLPGWVHGRVDALAVAIYEAARQYATAL